MFHRKVSLQTPPSLNTQVFIYSNPELYPTWVEIFDNSGQPYTLLHVDHQIYQLATGMIGIGGDNNNTYVMTHLVPPPATATPDNNSIW